jgi:hypothetical protein
MNGHNPLTQFYITINLGNVDSTITQTRLCIITCVSLTPTVPAKAQLSKGLN